MRAQSHELLVGQLEAALADVAAGGGDSFEVAVLAGMLSRQLADGSTTESAAAQQALTRARELRQPSILRDGLPDVAVMSALAEQIFDVDEQVDLEEQRELLCDLDEFCVGAWFLGESERYAGQVAEIAAAIRAFPELWRELSPWASRLLAAEPPLQGDPSLEVWQAVESSVFPVGNILPPACHRAEVQLGTTPTVALSILKPWGLHAQEFLSATEVKPQTPLYELVRGKDFEIGVALDAEGSPVLLIRCAAAPVLTRGGVPVALSRLAPSLFSARALPGEYLIRTADEELRFEVTE